MRAERRIGPRSNPNLASSSRKLRENFHAKGVPEHYNLHFQAGNHGGIATAKNFLKSG
jgi:hypothetical protein